MIKEFIPYEQALELKELGFDEECLAKYFDFKRFTNSPRFSIIYGDYENYFKNSNLSEDNISAPLWQQAFDWFTSLGYHSYIEGAYPWFRYYINSEDNRWEGYKHLKIEEARLECLKKLIEIVSNKTEK